MLCCFFVGVGVFINWIRSRRRKIHRIYIYIYTFTYEFLDRKIIIKKSIDNLTTAAAGTFLRTRYGYDDDKTQTTGQKHNTNKHITYIKIPFFLKRKKSGWIIFGFKKKGGRYVFLVKK